jgi:hypothetical protein
MDSILKWLNKNGYEYTWNFKLGARAPDLIVFKESEVLAFVFVKSTNNLSEIIRQCISYLDKVNASYIVFQIQEAKISDSNLKSLREHGIGLIGVNKEIKALVDAEFHEKDIDVLLTQLKEKSFTQITGSPNKSEETKKKILSVLEQHPEGLPILDIAKFSDLHRHTITKYVYELIDENKIYQRNLGPVKLHYLATRLIQPVKEKLILKKLKRQIK